MIKRFPNLWILLFLVVLLSVTSGHAQVLQLSPEEQEWLKSHTSITMAFDSDFAPYSFKNMDGTYEGVAVDFANEIAERLGITIKVYPHGKWKTLYKAALDHEVDVIATLAYLPEREEFFSYTKPYITLSHYVVTRKYESDIVNREQIVGRKVALIRGYSMTRVILKEFPGVVPVYVDTLTDALEAVSIGKAEATVAAIGMTHYLVAKHALLNLELRTVYAKGYSKQCFGVRKDWAPLAKILDKTLAAMSEKERLRHFAKWIPTNVVEPGKLNLTSREKRWLKNHPEIRLGADNHREPFQFFDSAGIYKGIAADHVRHLSAKLKVQMKPSRHDSLSGLINASNSPPLDILAAVPDTPDVRSRYLLSKPIMEFPLVIITHKDGQMLKGLEDLAGKRVGYLEGYSVDSLINVKHPQVICVGYKHLDKALEALDRKEISAVIDSQVTAGYIIQKRGLDSLRVAAPTPYTLNLHMAVRKELPILAGIVDKGAQSLSPAERKAIEQGWLNIRVEKAFHWQSVAKIVIPVIIIVLFFIIWMGFWNRRLSHEIAERLVIEKDLNDAKETAESASLAKSIFLSNMSHEIRTPMNAILGFSEILINTPLEEKQKHYLENIRNSGHSLLTLINDILDLSKIEAGKLELHPGDMDLKHALEEIVQLFERKAKEKGVAMRMDVDNHVPERLLLDSLRIRQILLNLVGNSLKFTDAGYISVSAKSSKSSKGKGHVDISLSVEDTGVGMDAGASASIFQAFEQIYDDGSAATGGTGLGLAITKCLVELMNGDIRVTSQKNVGTIFCVMIPNVEVVSSDVPLSEKESVGINSVMFKGSTVIIADDVEFNRELLTCFLGMRNLICLEAEHGRDVMTLLRKYDVDLILLDMKMPVMSGYEVVDVMKSHSEFAQIPIIAVTASALKHDEERIKESCEAYLRKPITQEQVLNELIRFLPYQFEESPIDDNEVSDLDLDDLPEAVRNAAVSVDAITSLMLAAERADYDALMSGINDIKNQEPVIGAYLMTLAENFNYEGIEKFCCELHRSEG